MTGQADVDGFFADSRERALFDAVHSAVVDLGEVEVRVSRSQIAFRRRHPFAWVWRPGRYLRGDVAPLVLTIGLRRRDASPRWKEVVEPRPGRFTHHLELRSPNDVDAEVRGWLAEAWAEASS